MALLSNLKDRLTPWPDPYQYECTVCGTTFNTERSACRDCGGAVERVDSATALGDPQP